MGTKPVASELGAGGPGVGDAFGISFGRAFPGSALRVLPSGSATPSPELWPSILAPNTRGIGFSSGFGFGSSFFGGTRSGGGVLATFGFSAIAGISGGGGA